MRILVTGAGGQLGAALLELLRGHDVRGAKRPETDIRDAVAVRRAIDSFRPDAIVHAAALTHVDYCEDHPDEAFAINAEGTRNVVEAAGSARVVYLSTEYVFDGRNGPYSEEDPPNPLGVYARSKLEGEQVARTAQRWSIVRTTVVYGYRPGSKNFLMQVLRGKPMCCATDQFSNPTLAENLAEAIGELIECDLDGIIHLVGLDRTDRYSFARSIARRFGLNEKFLTPVLTSELRQRAPRPLQAGLKIEKASRLLRTRLWGIDESLEFAHRKSRNS